MPLVPVILSWCLPLPLLLDGCSFVFLVGLLYGFGGCSVVELFSSPIVSMWSLLLWSCVAQVNGLDCCNAIEFICFVFRFLLETK
jgi:hypothetical protein